MPSQPISRRGRAALCLVLACLPTLARAELGATPGPQGVRFRVWAPGVKAVGVAGEFNNWTAAPLAREPNSDAYSGTVASAHAGQHYKFVITDASGNTLWRQDPRSAQLVNSVGDSIVADLSGYAWQATNFQMPPWNQAILYEVHVGAFNARFTGVTAKLPYLRALGVNLLELMPVAEFAGDSSWGYNPAYPYAPESAYGDPAELMALIDAAHAAGIGVLIDVVHNHYGPSDLDLWCFTGDCLGHGGYYFYTDDRASTPWGATRPDYGRAEVRSYVEDAALLWTGAYHADGLRWDATKFIRGTGGGASDIPDGARVLREANDALHGAMPWKLSIAEDMAQDSTVTAPTSSGGLGFSSQWDAHFVSALRQAATVPDDASRDMQDVASALTDRPNGQATQRVIYTESHDACANGQARLPEQIWPGNAASWYSKKRSTLAAALTLTAPGMPMLLEGQEFLEDGSFSDSRPVDWAKASSHAGILQLYTDLIALRRDLRGTTAGLTGDNINAFHVNNTAKVIAYHRWAGGGAGDDVVVLANFSDQSYAGYTIGMPRSGHWRVRFNSDWSGYDPTFANSPANDTDANGAPRDGLGQSATVGLGPYTVVILSQDP